MGIILSEAQSRNTSSILENIIVSRKRARWKGKRGQAFLEQSVAGLGIPICLIHNQNKFLYADKTAKEVEPVPAAYLTSDNAKGVAFVFMG